MPALITFPLAKLCFILLIFCEIKGITTDNDITDVEFYHCSQDNRWFQMNKLSPKHPA